MKKEGIKNYKQPALLLIPPTSIAPNLIIPALGHQGITGVHNVADNRCCTGGGPEVASGTPNRADGRDSLIVGDLHVLALADGGDKVGAALPWAADTHIDVDRVARQDVLVAVVGFWLTFGLPW